MDNRRHTIVINKKFQYQYSLLIVSLAVLIANAFIIVRILVPSPEPLILPSSTILGLAAIEFIMIAAIWYGALKASHRIAGPVHVITRELARLGEGDLNAKIALRDKDEFQAEAAQINNSIAALRSRIENVKALAQQLQSSHEIGADINPMLQKLAAELAGFSDGNK